VYIEDDRGTVRRLKEAGLDAELIEYPGVEHRITPEMQQHLTSAIAEACF
jgi:acetyl esterase/lipase